MGLGGLEPPTSRLSGVRSNQLSYRPTPSQCRGGDRACRGGVRPHCPPSPWVLREPEPGRVSEGQIGPSRRTDQAESRPQAPEREKNSARATNGPFEDDLGSAMSAAASSHHTTGLPRKEVIQPHLPVRLPCYDLAPITGLTLGTCPLAVGTVTSGATNFRGLTGGVYKARERIHRCLLISDY